MSGVERDRLNPMDTEWPDTPTNTIASVPPPEPSTRRLRVPLGVFILVGQSEEAEGTAADEVTTSSLVLQKINYKKLLQKKEHCCSLISSNLCDSMLDYISFSTLTMASRILRISSPLRPLRNIDTSTDGGIRCVGNVVGALLPHALIIQQSGSACHPAGHGWWTVPSRLLR